jgi:hypothetical protein
MLFVRLYLMLYFIYIFINYTWSERILIQIIFIYYILIWIFHFYFFREKCFKKFMFQIFILSSLSFCFKILLIVYNTIYNLVYSFSLSDIYSLLQFRNECRSHLRTLPLSNRFLTVSLRYYRLGYVLIHIERNLTYYNIVITWY